MKKFIEYVLSFEPDFLEKVEGATPKEIETLERVVGFPLPQQYRDFLLLMGKNTANFSFLAGEVSTNINEVTEFYQEIKDCGEPIPDNYVVIGVGNYIEDICITSDREENNVMILDSGKIVRYEAESLETLMLKMVFTKYKMLLFTNCKNYGDARKEKGLLLAKTLAKELGFQILWFSDAVEICGQKNNAAINIYQSQHEGVAVGGISVCVRAKSKREVREIGDVFAEKLGLKRLD